MPRTLFVVDDSATMRKVFELSFAGEDVTVITHDGSEGVLGRAREVKPNAAIVDVGLAHGSSYDLVKTLRAEAASSPYPVYLLYSDHSPLDEASARACGAAGAIAKPFESQAVIDRVKQAFATATVISTVQPTGNLTAPFGSPAGTPARPAEPPPARPPTASAASPLRAATPPLPQPTSPAARPGVPPLARAAGPGPMVAPAPMPRAPAPPVGRPAAPVAVTAQAVPAVSTPDDELTLEGDLSVPARAPAAPPAPAPAAPVQTAPRVPAAKPAEPPAAPAPKPAEPVVREAPVAKPAEPVKPVVREAPAAAMPTPLVDTSKILSDHIQERVAAMGLSNAQAEAVLALSRDVVERVVWEVVPQLAETMIREELKRLTAE